MIINTTMKIGILKTDGRQLLGLRAAQGLMRGRGLSLGGRGRSGLGLMAGILLILIIEVNNHSLLTRLQTCSSSGNL